MFHGIATAIMLLSAATGVFTLDDDGKVILIKEDGKNVLAYRYEPGDLPRFVTERYRRACYIHPLYGLDGEEMTQDFPFDHFHHRGVFWAWPESLLGDKKMDVWALDGARQVHAEWLTQEANDERAEMAIVNHWVYDEAPDVPIIREEVRWIVHPEKGNARAIDFTLSFQNIADEVFTIKGSGTESKGYGGFCLRPDATRLPMIFTSKQGKSPEDVLSLETPWVDVSFAVTPGEPKISGMAIFQHPGNPGYPHPGWILRHYGFLGQSFPHTQEHVLKPKEILSLKYRLFLHRGTAEEAQVSEAFQAYLAEMSGKI